MSMYDYKKMIEIANSFKGDAAAGNRNGYRTPNRIFCFILRELLNHRPEGLILEIETNDPKGLDPDESYYDLLVVRFEEVALCLPAPILEKVGLIAAMKAAKIVPRKEHNRDREGKSLSKEERSMLFRDLADQVALRHLVQATNAWLE